MEQFPQAPQEQPEKEEVVEKEDFEKFEQEAADQEKGLLERFQGKAKNIAQALTFVTALTFTAGMTKEAYAGPQKEKPKVESLEKEKSQEQQAVDFLEKLYNIPDNPRAVNPAQNKIMKQRAAKTMIQFYTLEQKGLKTGLVSPEDIKQTLQELNNATGAFADKKFGDNDGEVDIEDMNEFNKAVKDNAGLKALMEMQLQYSQ